MPKKHVTLSHPIREQLAEVVLGLEHFDLAPEAKRMLVTNRHSWSAKKPAGKPSLLSRLVPALQSRLGMINVRRFTTEADIAFANGGFLLADTPYVPYVEKPTQLFGYSSANYGKPLARLMLAYLLRRPQLKAIFFRTQAAKTGMLNLPGLSRKSREIIERKGVVIYPPLANPGKPSLARFEALKEVRFLFVSSIFYEKGGLELFNAFRKLAAERTNCRLTVITKLGKLRDADRAAMEACPQLELLDAAFSREELFDQFFNRSHVFAYPTYSDSFSAVINEALSAYLPVITSDFYSIPERITDGYNGFMFPSPFPNYDKNLVITEEHFQPGAAFPTQLRPWQESGKLAYVEAFLYEKMLLLVDDQKTLFTLAKNAKESFETKLNPEKIRETVDRIFLEATA